MFVYSLLFDHTGKVFSYLSMVNGRFVSFNYTGKVFHKFGKGAFLYMRTSKDNSYSPEVSSRTNNHWTDMHTTQDW